MDSFLLDKNDPLLLNEKFTFLQTASRTNTAGTIFGPILTAAVIYQDSLIGYLYEWLLVMFACVSYRTYVVFYKNKSKQLSVAQKISNLTIGVLSVTLCWGLGWVILVPNLPFNLQCLYMLMSSTAIFVGLYGYSIHRPTFLCFALPIFIPQFIVSLIPPFIFPWPVVLGEFAFSLYALKMSSYFSNSWIKTVSLQIQNQKLNKSLESERNVAIAANIAKSKFIATASHDLRQPLHAVNIYLDLFDSNFFNQKDKDNFLQIKNSIHSLNAMFNSLLDLSKFDAGFSKNNNASFRLSTLILKIRNTFLPIAEGKNNTFKIDYNDMEVQGDILLLQQLLGNLISNAIYYTTEGDITLKFSTLDDQLHVSVNDTGHGIEPAAIDKIFDEFYRVDNTRNMHDGLGLGLSIVKRLCAIIGAEISVQSKLGVGTTFNIQTSYQTRPVVSNIESFEEILLNNKNNISFERKVIAIFEDDPTIFQAYTKLLSQQGCNIISLSENLDEISRELANIDRIDCILSDFRLKYTTGDQIIQFLRESFGTDIPAIIVTADTSPDHIKLFNELNIVVLYKPIGYDEIVNQIKLLTR